MQNLRDKLLKAGLVTEDQAQQAKQRDAEHKAKGRDRGERPPRAASESGTDRPYRSNGPSNRPPRGNHTARRDERHDRPERSVPKLPPLPGSKEYQRQEAAKQRAIDLALRELVMGGQVPVEPGAKTFYFVTRKGKLRRLELSEAQAQLLETGKLAVVERQEPAQIEHSLVPPEVAEKMLALYPKSVRFLNKEGVAVGFLSDDEVKAQAAADAQGDTSETSSEPASEEPVAQGTPDHSAAGGEGAGPSSSGGQETWISIKRANK